MCSDQHLPSYIENAKALREAGLDDVYIVAVNDAFVTSAWAKERGTADSGLKVMADPFNALAKAWNLVNTTAGKFLGNDRVIRFAAVVNDGTLEYLQTTKGDDDTPTFGDKMLEFLKSQ
ncbi:PRDX5 [Symbiodinium sp. KB8]|nr:PRDX5 [Symbiodinium sp. KB8]